MTDRKPFKTPVPAPTIVREVRGGPHDGCMEVTAYLPPKTKFGMILGVQPIEGGGAYVIMNPNPTLTAHLIRNLLTEATELAAGMTDTEGAE